MLALFLESKAHAQCLLYAQRAGLGKAATQDLCDRAYKNAKEHRSKFRDFDNWFIDHALKGESHRGLDLNAMFNWAASPEDHAYWSNIHRSTTRDIANH